MKLGFFIFLNLFLLPFFACLPAGRAFAGVVINEIAWMGSNNGGSSSADANDEWIELYNSGQEDVNLDGWTLIAEDGSPSISISSDKCVFSCVLSASGFFLLERTDDTTVSDIAADLIYTGALSNDGEILILKDVGGNEVDRIDASAEWPAGDNTTKETMQKSDSGWITATGTPKAQNVGGSSQSQNPPPLQQPPQSQTSGGGSSQYIPPEQLPKIKAYAGEDKTSAVGALVEFRGMAFGFDDKPLANARFVWNFGDGATKEGQNVFYSYRYPGAYAVTLDISSGEYAVSDRLAVKVVPAEISISEVKPGENSFIEIYNNSKEELNISGWQVSFGTQSFFFPKGSYIRPQSYLVVSNSTSGINLSAGKGLVRLSYVGGSAADVFNYEGVLTEGQSFSRQDKESVITKETPGSANILTASAGAIVKKEIVSAVVKENKIPDNKDKEIVSGAAVPPEESSPANVFSATKESGSSGGTKFYFFVVLGLAVFSGVGVFLVRRQQIKKED